MNNNNKGTKFIVLSSQRSGSTWLMSLLKQLENTTAYGEIFLRQKRDPGISYWDSDLSYHRFIETEPLSKIRPISVFAYLDNLYRQPGAVGFKLMYSQVQLYPELAFYLILHRIRVVHLIRQNFLDVIISEAVMRKINHAHIVSEKTVPKDIQIELNPENLIARLNRKQKLITNARKMLRWCGLSHIEANYEDLTHDPDSFLSICNFLSINPEKHMPQSMLVKINRKSHSEMISNYEVVKNTLEGTPFAHFIE